MVMSFSSRSHSVSIGFVLGTHSRREATARLMGRVRLASVVLEALGRFGESSNLGGLLGWPFGKQTEQIAAGAFFDAVFLFHRFDQRPDGWRSLVFLIEGSHEQYDLPMRVAQRYARGGCNLFGQRFTPIFQMQQIA